MNDVLFDNHREAAPPAPEADALGRVHDEARRIVQSRALVRSRGSKAWRLAATVTATVAVVGVAAWGLSPRVDDSAFARQQAVAALMPQDGVLHTKSTFTLDSSYGSKDRMPTRVSVSEEWIDMNRSVSRGEVRSPETGALEELTVAANGVVRSLGRDGGYDEKTREFVPGSWRLAQYDNPGDITPTGGLLDWLREGIETGDAQVVDRITLRGEEFWVVERVVEDDDPKTGSSRQVYRGTMAVDDYVLRELSIERESDHPVDGKGWETITVLFSVWETVERGSLSADFFDPNQVDKAAPSKTIVDAPPLEPQP